MPGGLSMSRLRSRKPFWAKLLAELLCLWAVFVLSGCGGADILQQPRINFKDIDPQPVLSTTGNDTQTLKVAVTSVLPITDTLSHYRAIANVLGERLNRPAILIQRKSYAEVGLLLLNGGADIAFFASGEYATYSSFEEIEMLAMQQRMGLPYYQGYLLVSADSEMEELEDLRGKSVAFSDPLSYSGYFSGPYVVAKRGDAGKLFGRYMYTYSHEKSFRAVANKIVDAAPVPSLIYERAKQKNPELASSVRVIAISPPAGTGPVVVRKNMSLREREILRDAFLKLHENPRTQQALKGLMIDRYVSPRPELFENSRRMLKEKRTRL